MQNGYCYFLLYTEPIIVPFSSKGVNQMAYLAHVATVVWCVLLFV